MARLLQLRVVVMLAFRAFKAATRVRIERAARGLRPLRFDVVYADFVQAMLKDAA